MDKREGEVSRISSNFFCLAVPKNFVGEHFCAVSPKVSGSNKKYGREGVYQNFPSKVFRLKVTKKIVGEPFIVSLFSGIEKFYASGGYVTIFRRKFFVSQYQIISQRNHSMLCFRKFLVAQQFMDKREGDKSRFPSKIFCLTVSKNAVREHFSLSLISGIKKVWMRRWGGSIKIFHRKFFVSRCRKIS